MSTEKEAMGSRTFTLLLLAAAVAAAGAGVASGHGPSGHMGANTSVSFVDQESDGDSVVVQHSTHTDDYVVVVHADDDGPAAILGHAEVDNGTNLGLEVDLNQTLEEGNHTLHAMLHRTSDEGDYGSPLSVEDQIVVDDAEVTVDHELSETDDDEVEDGDEAEVNDTDADGDGEGLPGFTALAALVALISVALLSRDS